MKKPIHVLLATLIAPLAMGQAVVYEDDFESYMDGQMLVATVGLPWSTWTGAASEDVTISSEQAASGELSARFSSTEVGGGPGDIMLRLGNRTEGSYLVNWNMYVPAGFGGYFNLQHNEVPGAGSWAVDVTLRADGTIEYSDNVTATVTTYQHDQWMNVSMVFDLDNFSGTLLLDGQPAATWMTNIQSDGTAGMNQLGGINFFPYAGGDQTLFYIDDVSYINLFSTDIAVAELGSMAIFPNPTEGIVTVELNGVGPDAMVSLWDLTGRKVVSEHNFGQYGAIARAQMDLSNLPSGVFLIRIQDGGKEIVQRIVRQ